MHAAIPNTRPRSRLDFPFRPLLPPLPTMDMNVSNRAIFKTQCLYHNYLT